MKKIIALMLVGIMTVSTQYYAFAEGNAAEKEETQAKDPEDMTDDEFKEICEEMWYDDILFGKAKEIEGENVKLDLFIEEIYSYTDFEIRDSYQIESMVKEYGLGNAYVMCGVRREGETLSYFGEPIKMMAKEGEDNCMLSIKPEDHITFYGTVISCLKNFWTGYNNVTVMPRIIENNG